MKHHRKITIFEGPDCGGKSTLVNRWRQKSAPTDRPRVFHHGAYKRISEGNQARLYLETMMPALVYGEHVILDRCWLSEPIYGRAFRNGEDRIGVASRRHLDRIAMSREAVVVLCLPPFEAVAEQWKKRQADGDEYLEKLEQLEMVYEDYEQLHRQTDLPVVRYDYTADDGQPLDNYDRFRTRLHTCALQIRTVGNWQAPIVMVGDAPSEPSNQDLFWQAPLSSFSAQGCSRWLTDLLEEHGLPETAFLWMNSENQDLSFLVGRPETRLVVALGENASERLTKEGVAHQKVHHPQYAKRFKGDQSYDLINHIKEHL